MYIRVHDQVSEQPTRPDAKKTSQGAIAQLGERLPCTQEVGGSIPPGSTILSSSALELRSHSELCVANLRLDLNKMVGDCGVALKVIKRKENFSFNDLLLFNNLEISDVLSGLSRRIFSCLCTGKDESQFISSVAFAHVTRHGSACTVEQENKGSCSTKGSNRICNPPISTRLVGECFTQRFLGLMRRLASEAVSVCKST